MRKTGIDNGSSDVIARWNDYVLLGFHEASLDPGVARRIHETASGPRRYRPDHMNFWILPVARQNWTTALQMKSNRRPRAIGGE
jgi:hypothetical protein